MADTIIDSSRYIKKTLTICLLLGVVVVSAFIIAGSIKEEGRLYLHQHPGEIFVLAFFCSIILVPAILVCVYLAFLGTRKFKKNPNTGPLYYLIVFPLAVLSCIISAFLGWFLLPDAALFVFFGGYVIGAPVFIILCIFGIVELYLIKQSIKRLVRRRK